MDILKTGKDLRRLNEIVNILIKFGFGDVIRRIGLAESLEKAGKLIRYSVPDDFLSSKPPERARAAMEEMGPTFIKLGQIMATRVDLFTQDWIQEFEKLQDETQSVPLDSLRDQLEQSLGMPIEQAFRYVDEKPLGTASMAQVHKAITHKNQAVALKIRKPDIRHKIESDIRLIKHLARVAQSQSVELRRYRPVAIVKEFERSLLRELDFSIEAKNAERIAENLKNIKYAKVPKIYWEWTCEDLNVQEFIDGIPAKNVNRIDAAGLDRKLIAHRGGKIVWKSMLIDGFFHADPHPGNFLILPKNKIAILDFGMVGKLSHNRREQLMKLTRSIVLQDGPGAAAVLLEWTDGNVDFDALVGEGEDLIQQFYGLSLSEVNIPQLIVQVTDMLRTFDIALPPDIALFSKACITLEGFGRLLNPDFDLMTEAEPLIREWGKNRYSPTSLAKKLSMRALSIVDKIYEEPKPHAPVPANTTSTSNIDKQFIERLAMRHERAQFRHTQLMVTVGFLIASAILTTVETGPQFLGMSVLGIIGLLIAIGSTHFLLFILWWSHRSLD
ncbi:ABC transporter [Gammaproteobacteria bacterium 45_16_T64]|nr:ABC transporter [Gammaproteobacteria bacterium 45_16_T64]